MNGPAWIFAVAFVVLCVVFVIVEQDRQAWKKRATTRQGVLTNMLARHAALIITLKLAGIHVHEDPVGLADLDRAVSPADIPWMSPQRRGGAS